MATSSEKQETQPAQLADVVGDDDVADGRGAESTDLDTLGPDERVVPTWTESLAKQASKIVGGPLGRHAVVGRHWFWTPLRVVLLIALVTLMCGWFVKAPCIQQYNNNGTQQLDWRANRQYVSFCYTDIVPLYGSEQLDRSGTFPYQTSWPGSDGQTHYMEYPVVTGLFQWASATVSRGWVSLAGATGILPTGLPVVVYFDITALLLALAWVITVWATTRTARRRPWDAALVALSPLVVVQAFTNFDALATAATAAALLAWSRRKPTLAGVLIGVGAATKLYPAFLLIPLLLLCWRAGKLRQGWQTTGWAAVAWAVINVPIAIRSPSGWWEFFKLSTLRGADSDSIYSAISYFTGWSGFDPHSGPTQAPTVLNAVTAALFLIACAGIAWIALSAPRRPRLPQLCFLLIAVFLLVNKVWSPQYSLWLVPLAVLAIPRWKLLLTWMFLDALVWFPRMAFFLEQTLLAQHLDDRGLPEGWFLGAVIIRDLMVIGLCVLVIRDIYRPSADLVRMAGDDDPAGGFLAGAPDRFTLGGARQRQAAHAA